MPRARGTSGDIEDLPIYIRRAHGVPAEWKSQGLCRQHSTVPGVAWRVDPREKTPEVIGGQRYDKAELEKLAAEVCSGCPVQWDCTSYAIVVGELVGTWGVRLETLKAMQKDEVRALAVIRRAQATRVTVRQAWSERHA